jgi:hypothetical protein
MGDWHGWDNTTEVERGQGGDKDCGEEFTFCSKDNRKQLEGIKQERASEN